MCLTDDVVLSFPDGLFDIDSDGPDGKAGILAMADYIQQEENQPFMFNGCNYVHVIRRNGDGGFSVTGQAISELPRHLRAAIKRARAEN